MLTGRLAFAKGTSDAHRRRGGHNTLRDAEAIRPSEGVSAEAGGGRGAVYSRVQSGRCHRTFLAILARSWKKRADPRDALERSPAKIPRSRECAQQK
jgi:hypothetical protein